MMQTGDASNEVNIYMYLSEMWTTFGNSRALGWDARTWTNMCDVSELSHLSRAANGAWLLWLDSL
jgi:hypothetical protein